MHFLNILTHFPSIACYNGWWMIDSLTWMMSWYRWLSSRTIMASPSVSGRPTTNTAASLRAKPCAVALAHVVRVAFLKISLLMDECTYAMMSRFGCCFVQKSVSSIKNFSGILVRGGAVVTFISSCSVPFPCPAVASPPGICF